jgi:type IV pilus assembly protein PilP
MAIHSVQLCLLLVTLMVAVEVRAQAEPRTPSQSTKEALEKVQHAPATLGQKLQDAAKTVKTKLLEAVTTRADSVTEPMPNDGKVAQPQEPKPVRIGTRDPFRPFTLNARPVTRRRENLSPLERFELAQLKLVGVIWNTREPKAMVEDSSGLGYVVHVGTPIGPSNGKVKAIRQNEIIIEESFVDLYGDRKRREVGMRILAGSAE